MAGKYWLSVFGNFTSKIGKINVMWNLAVMVVRDYDFTVGWNSHLPEVAAMYCTLTRLLHYCTSIQAYRLAAPDYYTGRPLHF